MSSPSTGRGAALQDCGHREASEECEETRASPGACEAAAKPKAQLGAEAALDTGGDHVGAPEQEPNIAAELQQDQSARHLSRSERLRSPSITQFPPSMASGALWVPRHRPSA